MAQKLPINVHSFKKQLQSVTTHIVSFSFFPQKHKTNIQTKTSRVLYLQQQQLHELDRPTIHGNTLLKRTRSVMIQSSSQL